MQGQGCRYMAYLDDILIYSRTEKEHFEMLDNAFKCLLKAGLKIKLSKCLFFKECYVRQGWFICVLLLELSRDLHHVYCYLLGALQYTMAHLQVH